MRQVSVYRGLCADPYVDLRFDGKTSARIYEDECVPLARELLKLCGIGLTPELLRRAANHIYAEEGSEEWDVVKALGLAADALGGDGDA